MGRCLNQGKSTFKKPDQEVVITFVVFSQSFQLAQDRFNANFRIFVRSLSHVVDSEVISFQKLEVVDAKANN